MKKTVKVVSINLAFIIFIILVFELLFGHWFEKNYFGYNMKGKRLQKIDFEIDKKNIKKKWTYRRDYYGFREEFDFKNKYDLSKVEIVFTGGSTGSEMIMPYEETIVGNLNKYLKTANLNIKIFNASLDGKSLIGKINDFDQWFDKLENFNPKMMIFYMGLTDRRIPQKRFNDNNEILSKKDYIIAVISQRSFIWDKLKNIKNFYIDKRKDGYSFFENAVKGNKDFINYKLAQKIYITPNNEELKILENYKKNLKRLNSILKEREIIPVFITQIRYDGNGESILFYLNEELKEFSLTNNYRLIPLDELIDENVDHLFFDKVHTNEKGSYYIANKIYPSLKRIIVSDLIEKKN